MLRMKKLAFMDSSVWLWDTNSTLVLTRCRHAYISLAFFLSVQILFLSEILVMNDSECCRILLTNPPGPFQGLIMLEKELAYLGSVCAAALMKKDLALPIGMETVDELVNLF